jgi:hypothetical protein
MLAHLHKLKDEGRAGVIAPYQAAVGGHADVETVIWKAL